MKWLENADEQMYSPRPIYRVFSRDVTAAMLVSLNKGTAAILVSPTYRLGYELYSYASQKSFTLVFNFIS